jgi:protein-S-isoprenylcysteine O-methyltransferase Ste14
VSFVAQLIIGVVIQLAFFGGLLFGPAGTLRWPRAWIFLAVLLVCTVWSMTTVMRADEALMAERWKPPIQRGQPLADRIVILLLIASLVAELRFIPLDVFHYHLLGGPGLLVSTLGLLLFVAGWGIATFALKANTFAAPVVRYQKERHHRVVDTGPYAVVRHPMYAGGIPLFLGIPLWLGSYAGALLALVPIALLGVRILIEERLLKRELAGYDAYMRSTRFRLIPYVW